jgi:phage shock protein A
MGYYLTFQEELSMAIFKRITDVLKANINDLLDKAEDPEKMVKLMIIDMEEHLSEATQGLGQIMASERQARKQLEGAQQQSALWEERAKTALKAGDESLAKQAVEKKIEADENVKKYEKAHSDIEVQVEALKGQVDIIKQKTEEARQRMVMVSARARVAKARSGMAEATGPEGAFSKMGRMEEKVDGMEALADAEYELSGLGAKTEDKFAELEKKQSADEELERLTKEINKENKQK